VNELKIAPSEAWKLDIAEVVQLLDNQSDSSIDTSIMLNFERIKNGASKQWLQKN
tara:strand:- start:24 stop:188 length:165 start_codon:yes stop_codon:yes gene_type:complete